MVAINETVMLSVIGTVATQQHVHTLHFRANGVGSMTALLTDWQSTSMTAYRGMFRLTDNPCQILRATHVCGSLPLNATIDVIPTTANQAGTRATTTANEASLLAALVSVKGESSGRRRQGRFFIGGLMGGDIVGNDLNAAHVGRVQAYCTAITTAYISATSPSWRLVVHSRYLSEPHPAYTDSKGNAIPAYTPGNCQDISTPVAALIVRPSVTTMRSRKPGHGN